MSDDTLKNPNDHPNDIIFITSSKGQEFIGGSLAMYKFISQNLNNSITTKKGRVNARVVIEKDGSVGNVEIMRGLSPETDAEATRVLKLLPKWTPAQYNYKNIRCYYHIPIHFK